MSTLSKKQRKEMRKQMADRKQQLLAQHGRGSGASHTGKSWVGQPATKAFTSSGTNGFHGSLPSAAGPVRWEPPTPADRSQLPPPLVASPKPTTAPNAATSAAAVIHKPTCVATVKITADDASTGNLSTDSLEPASLQSANAVFPWRDLDATQVGPLTRLAAALEHHLSRGVALYQARPWRQRPLLRRPEAHRTLSLLIRPLRWLGLATLAGAFALGRESRSFGVSDTGSLVVLGMGLALAVLLLAAAEIAGGLRVLLIRQ